MGEWVGPTGDRERAALAWVEAITLPAETGAPDDIYERARGLCHGAGADRSDDGDDRVPQLEPAGHGFSRRARNV